MLDALEWSNVRETRNSEAISEQWKSLMKQPKLAPGEALRMCKVIKVLDDRLRATMSNGKLSPYMKAISVSLVC